MTSVWVKVYIGQDDQDPRTSEIKQIPENISDLKEKVKEKRPNDLNHCDAARLDVYPVGTDVSNLEGAQKLDPQAPMEEVALPKKRGEYLIVVAPKSTLGPAVEQPPPQGTDQQQQQESSLAAQKMLQRSQQIVAQWTQGLTLPTTVDGLRNAVRAVLPKALPSPYHATITGLDQPVGDVLAVANEAALLVPQLAKLVGSIYSSSKFGENEDSVHSLIDALVLDPMKIIGDGADCIFKWNRNGIDASGATVKGLRPDVLMWLPSGVLAFKGEDKALESDIGMARCELLTKLGNFSDTFFGQAQYQICYAAGGSLLEFLVITRDPSGGRPTCSSLTDQVNLSTVRGRSLCVRYAINIARVLVSLQRAHPEGSVVRLGSRITTHSSVVEVFGDFVRKQTKDFTGEVLQDLYQQIKDRQAPCLVYADDNITFTRTNGLTVHISPVGFCGRPPASFAEMVVAGRQILTALIWLHENGWVHRDIRPQNILFADGRWYLMDLEWANIIDSEMARYHPQQEFTPPELIGMEEGKWTSACDMWQFGKLINSWGHLNSNGQNYVSTQRSSTPSNRLSAKESLSHQLFAEAV